MTTMLYAHPGQHKIHGDDFDYIIVEENQVDEAIDKGWCLTTPEAKKKYDKVMAKKNAKPPSKPTQLDIKPETEDDSVKPVDVPEAKAENESSLTGDHAKASE